MWARLSGWAWGLTSHCHAGLGSQTYPPQVLLFGIPGVWVPLCPFILVMKCPHGAHIRRLGCSFLIWSQLGPLHKDGHLTQAGVQQGLRTADGTPSQERASRQEHAGQPSSPSPPLPLSSCRVWGPTLSLGKEASARMSATKTVLWSLATMQAQRLEHSTQTCLLPRLSCSRPVRA